MRFESGWALVVAAALASASAVEGQTSQSGAITGAARDASTLRPMAGVQVALPGLSRGSITEANGRYIISDVPAGTHRLEVTYLGYAPTRRDVTVNANTTATADFELSVSAISLDEIVVTGVGVAEQRRRLGTSIGSVEANTMEVSPAANVTEFLQGRVAGMMPTAPRGESGSAAPIRLRGQVSITQRNDPVVYVDGVRVDATVTGFGGIKTSRLDDLNPRDIERMEVIKGAAAATLFGTEASSGVIQIFTKKGVEGAPRYSFSIDQEVFKLPMDKIQPMVAYDRVNNQLVSNNPAADFVRTGHRQAYSLSVSGGAANVKYYLSGRLLDETGVFPSSEMGNKSLRASLDMSHTTRFRTEFGVSVIRNNVRTPDPDFGYLATHVLANPLAVSALRPYGEAFETVAGGAAAQNYQYADVNTLNAKATYEWTPNITSQLVLGYNGVRERVTFTTERGDGPVRNVTGRRQVNNADRVARTVDFNTAWQTRITDAIGASLWGGGQAFFEKTEKTFAAVIDFPAPGLATLRGGSTITTLDESFKEVVNAGVFTQAQLDFRDRLFLTGGLRADGNSAFGDDFGVQLYPKAGLSWVISDELFWPGAQIGWSLLRFRAAHGTSGLQPGAFDAVRTWRPQTRLDGRSVVVPGNVGNASLKPERSIERELGVDVALFDERLGIEFTYYNQKTVDAILARPLPASMGFLEPQLVNIGEMKSSGVEALVNWFPIQTPSFGWRMTASASTRDQQVTKLGLGDVTRFRMSGPGMGQRHQHHIAIGYQPGAIIGTILDEANPYRLAVPVEQFSRLSQLTPNTLKTAAGRDSLVFLGNPQPDFTGSFSTEFTLPADLSLRALFSGATGFVTFSEANIIWYQSGTRREVAEMDMELANPATSTARRQEIALRHARKHPNINASFVEKGDYLRFGEVALSYEVPESLMGTLHLASLRVTLAAQNLFLWDNVEATGDPGAVRAGQIGNNDPGSLALSNDWFTPPSPRRLSLLLQGGW